MSSLAIITARGGSKRIPKKNIKEFCGKPIIAYSIEAAIGSKLFDEVMVSTDSEEIADVARKYGAAVPFMRSAETSDDYAGTEDVVAEVIADYENRGEQFSWVCCIYPTAPFVTAEKLQMAYGLFKNNPDAEAVLSVTQFSFPPQRGFYKRNGYMEFAWPEFKDERSQDLDPIYHDAGQFYFVRMDAFKAQHTVIPVKSMPLVFDDSEVQDIDNPTDWRMAELKFRALHDR